MGSRESYLCSANINVRRWLKSILDNAVWFVFQCAAAKGFAGCAAIIQHVSFVGI